MRARCAHGMYVQVYLLCGRGQRSDLSCFAQPITYGEDLPPPLALQVRADPVFEIQLGYVLSTLVWVAVG